MKSKYPLYGKWTEVRKLGSGSYGDVYEIQREDFGKVEKAALKVMSIPKSSDEIEKLRANGMSDAGISEYYKNFAAEIVQEYDLMGKLKGTTNIVSYEDHEVHQHPDGIGWDILIRMELLISLNQYLTQKQRHISKRDVIKLGIDLCSALERCQKFNIIHRDIKPDNIFVSSQGDFKLGDFGVARTLEETANGLTKTGTPSYMAPEVYKGAKYGYSVDIYSLGMVMYKLLNNNRLPFIPPYSESITPKEQATALGLRMNGTQLPLPCMDQNRLAEIVLKACSYLPEDRYTSPTAMKQELEAILYSKEEQRWILEYLDQIPTLPPTIISDASNVSEDETVTILNGQQSSEDKGKQKTGMKKPPAILFISLILVVAVALSILYVNSSPKQSASSSGNGSASYSSTSSYEDGISSSSQQNENTAQSGVVTEIGDAGYRLEKEYDDDGKLLKETQYHADGTLGFTYEYSYDEEANLLENIVRRAGGAIWKRIVNEYNDASQLLREESYENDELIYYSLYEWDEKGQKAAFSRFNAENTLEETHTFDYSEDGTYTETVKMGETGALSQSTALDGTVIDIVKVVYFYDVSGQMERQSDYDANDELVDYCEIKYDYRFRQTQQSWYYGNGVVEGHVEYKYSEDGSTTEETLYDANGKILLFIQNEHGADGRLTITQYDKERSIVAQEVYDEEGNSLSRDDYGTLEETSENQ